MSSSAERSQRLRSWMSESLTQGSRLANQVMAHRQISVLRLVRSDERADLPSSLAAGIGSDSATADHLASVAIILERSNGGRTLVVEDEMARRGDEFLEGALCCFVDDRVLRWTDLFDPDAESLLRCGSAGYPLNAMIMDKSDEQLGLAAGVDLDLDAIAQMVRSTTLVIVGALDGEGYVLGWPLSESHGTVGRA